jgi:predicted flap endonuclease-1-like 5' DNA nuclease
MMADGARSERTVEESIGDVPLRSRESGIMDVASADRERVEREASSVASAVQSGTNRDEDIDISTDDAPERVGAQKSSVGFAPVSGAPIAPTPLNGAASGDDGTIEVSDDEIEAADVPTFGVMRSRPPAPPSTRSRLPSSSALPPPRHLSSPPSSRPSRIDPWALANKTLELSRALARVVELEEQVAFRDARILELEERLAKSKSKLEELEQRSRPAASRAAAPVTPVSSSAPQLAVVSEAGSLQRAGQHAPEPEAVQSGIGADQDPEDPERESGFGENDDTPSEFVQSTSSMSSTPGSEEDLQQISGIGPRYEAALRKQGITRLSQIAAWSDADVRFVAKALKIPKSRIVKGRWVEVAREVIGTRSASE